MLTHPDTREPAAEVTRPPGARRVARRAARTARPRPLLGPLLVVLGLTLLVWGRVVLTDFTSERLSNPGDSASFEFYLAWNVHALLHGVDPFITPNMYAPTGLDLGNAISVPGPSILLAPVTLLLGPTAAYNTGVLLAIFLAGASTVLLATELGARRWGAGAAGALMVLNPYFTAHVLSHFNLLWIWGLPFVAWLAVRHANGRSRLPVLVVGTALVLAFTMGASSELALTEVVLGALAGLVALLLARPERRRVLWRTGLGLVTGGVLGGLLSLPVVLAALGSGVPDTPANPPALYSADLLNFVVPTRLFLLGGQWSAGITDDWVGNDAENSSYLPWVLLALVVALAVRRRDRLTAGLLVIAGLALVLSLGPLLILDGDQTIPLPWAVTAHVPGLDHALPARFSTVVFLALLLVLATCWPRTLARAWWATAAVVVTGVLLMPNLGLMSIPTPVSSDRFVADGHLADLVDDGDVVLVLPGGQAGPGLRWVEQSDFALRVPTGNGGGAKAPADLATPIGRAIFEQDSTFDYTGLKRWARERDVQAVVVPAADSPWLAVATRAFGPADETVNGFATWRLRANG